jgi:hypothetical protein
LLTILEYAMPLLRRTLIAMALIAAPSSLLAQQLTPTAVAQTSDAIALTADQRTAAIAEIVAAVKARYVFPERIPAIGARLNEGLASGRYATENPTAFADAVTADLRASSNDRHMYLNYSPTEFAAVSSGHGANGVADNKALDALRDRASLKANHGLEEMTILPGNVRYLRIRQFLWVQDKSGEAYNAAMKFLSGGDAVIIDLRGNGGGWHEAVRYLLSHFMDPDTLDMTFFQAGQTPIQSRTLDYLPAGRLKGKPLFVLIDGQVGSAAEAFAYDVQQFHLGTLVGAKTVGAANNNEFIPVSPGFMVSISSGRPVQPISGGNWEGVGVSPDIAVDPTQARDKAHAMALSALIAGGVAEPADRAAWEWARPGAEARLNPVSLSASTMRTLTGSYGGRQIVQREGSLRWLRKSGRVDRLIPLTTDGLFSVDGSNDGLHVRLTGQAMEIQAIDEPAPMKLLRD